MHLVEDYGRIRVKAIEEKFRIRQRPLHRGQITVEMPRVSQHSRKCRFPDASHAG